ncbi:MAG: HAD family hydrolase [Lachnospiraceae bacterium]|nr:HAD family hydrolase [Lachnospiraceae bacterium]
MKKGILLDMDGTLWDSAVRVAESWNIAVARMGYPREPITKEDMYHVMGKTMDRIAAELFPDVPEERLPELLKACCDEENDYLRIYGGELYPEVPETLKSLREMGYHLYIVSNCQAGYIEAFLDYYSLWDLIEDRQCYGDNGLQKAENIRILVERCGLDDAVYVGDIQGDFDSACEAGIGFIHAAYGFGVIDRPVPGIRAFSELPEAVRRIL